MSGWKEYLDNPTLNTVTADFVRSSEAKSTESTISVALPEPAVQSFKNLAAKHNVSEYEIGIALFLTLIYRISGDEDVIVGTALSDADNMRSVARYPSFNKDTTLPQLLEQIKLGESVARTNPAKDADIRALFGGQPLFNTQFLTGASERVPFKDITAVVDFKSNMTIRYNSLLFKRQRIAYLADEFVALVVGAGAGTALSGISLVTPSQLENDVIPDPTSNLDWDAFGGSIQDIFAKNAAAFPDRQCIVETPNIYVPGSRGRSFTYRQIDEASNIVAHYLLQNGIQIDDVVMIYAYRGVDLVIAVMGVLKAGATFSVIDPAYPAARQNIYLSVAKPRGLINLKKAGKLSPTVTEYIAENLDLKAELVGLELQDDGSLQATQDITSAEQLKDRQTGIKVGPDNHPTLSFTSGSEGIPKGVRGRHFSLTYYFPWMSKTFGISENDRFTMLSGIAHDPIQRDMFTPLFFGAQLYVPTSDDIGTPGRLAEWMAENECTITHLTPAMGQLLSAQATAQISGLRNAFFVGDILTKRDCLKLQALAHNTAIINMYGTTETQRAVSYFRVPSVNEDPQFLLTQKDVIPAGKGMLNVQMLVVNRNAPDAICGVGEIGEIYVRAAGLSDGYLDLPDMTAKKFLTSWFVEPGHWKSQHPTSQNPLWLGPRDRFYRTGDLGRYLPDGNTEVSGRADDQVKIRGFRIELGEINTHLSKHPYVRENITLVRRDKDEEPVIVAYVVPETINGDDDMLSAHESLDEDENTSKDSVVRGLVQYQRLLKDIRAYLKTKLPSYAIPSTIVPLPKMPLNPNGKIDKPRLPYPDTAQVQLAAQHLRKTQNQEDKDNKWTDSESRVWQLWSSILPNHPPAVEVTDSFFDLGGHSILATKMIFEARSKLGVPDLPLGTVFSSSTIKEFARAVDELKSGDAVLDVTVSASEPQGQKPSVSYSQDAAALVADLKQYKTPNAPVEGEYVAFLTGATGFLGAYILRDLLNRSQTKKVYAQVRAKDSAHGLERIRNTAKAYGLWNDKHASRIEVVTGSLETENIGLDKSTWERVVNEVDVVIHNGALVHWVYPYSTLRGPNVVGTLNMMSLCAEGKPKYFTFVSSTSVLDTPYYVTLSENCIEAGKAGIPESDTLDGSKEGLGTGYGQSKWVGEHLLRVAGEKHGLRGAILRPGYVVGDSKTGVSNTDDFLLRMLKGCQELQLFPDITNSVNMVPVDHVARATVAAALNSSILSGVQVAQVTSHPRITFEEFLGSLNQFGYTVKEAEYPHWRVALETFVVEKGDSALFPLLHFVLDNLPQDTKAPELDDANTRELLKTDKRFTGEDLSHGAGVDISTLSNYLSFLVAVGFLEKPQKAGLLGKTSAPDDVIANFENAGGRSK